MAVQALSVEKRSETGTTACRKLRTEGRIPAILYGHQQEAVNLVLAREALEGALREGSRALDLEMEGSSVRVVLKEVQYDPLGESILHVDFARISRDEVLSLAVTIHLQGMAKGVKEGGVLVQQLPEVEVQCSAEAIPDKLSVRVDAMEIGEVLRVKDLPLPEGVSTSQDPETLVAALKSGEEEEEEAPAEPGEEMKEPEVITAREKKEEEEG
jgi:large subunit ribosomal protein L25